MQTALCPVPVPRDEIRTRDRWSSGMDTDHYTTTFPYTLLHLLKHHHTSLNTPKPLFHHHISLYIQYILYITTPSYSTTTPPWHYHTSLDTTTPRWTPPHLTKYHHTSLRSPHLTYTTTPPLDHQTWNLPYTTTPPFHHHTSPRSPHLTYTTIPP